MSHSSDDGKTFAPFVAAAAAGVLPVTRLPNTTFRDGITENFTASATFPGHLYLTYENWDGTPASGAQPSAHPGREAGGAGGSSDLSCVRDCHEATP